MAPVSNKRARAQDGATDEVKKAKVVDPITEKVELITKTLKEPECQIQESHREMLLLAIPHVLTVPGDERHAYQTQVVHMVQKVLSDYVAYQEQQVSESKANISASSQNAQDTLKAVEVSAEKIGNQEEEVTRRKGVLQEDSEAVKAAEAALEGASKEVAEFDENLQATIAQKDKCTSIYNDHFTPLKAGGDFDAKELARLTKEVLSMLKKLSTEPSLLSAIAPAFKKAPAERGPFDTMAIEGAEGIFTKHLESLQEQIDKADVTKSEKIATETASQDTLKAATEKHTVSEDALKAAEEELASLEAKHVELFSLCNAASDASNASEAIVAAKEAHCTEVQLAFSTLTELIERQSTTPEPAADVSMAAEKLEAVCESCPMELTTVS